MTLGERIAAARNRAGLTQLQLAQELGLQLFQVADWERGAAEPSLEQMAALCRVLDVTSDYLLLGKEPESAKPICPRCGRVLEPGTHFCPDCGQDQLAAGGDTYCLVLNQPASHEEAAVMMQILRKGRFWPDFPFSEQGTQKDMYNALPQAARDPQKSAAQLAWSEFVSRTDILSHSMEEYNTYAQAVQDTIKGFPASLLARLAGVDAQAMA